MKVSNRSTLFMCILTFFLALGMALVCGTAMGQDSGDQEEFLLEDIVVTSEFREKSIQETPLSITAVNADMIEARNQITLDQLTLFSPSVTLRPNSASMGSSLVAFIRGIGQTDFNPSVEPGVAIYVDDVYYSTITGNILELLDLERVEILRGPQGTLAGRNAIGGAIKLFTRKADGSDDGFVSLTYGDFDRLDLKAAAGFTLIPDKLFVRMAGVSRSRDGYVTRLDYACHNNLPPPGTPGGLPNYTVSQGGLGCVLGTEGGQNMTAGRFSMRWVPSDNFEASFTANIVNDKSEAQPNVLIEAADNSGSALPILFQTAGPPIPNPAFNPNSISLVPIFFDNNGNGAYDAGIDIPYDNRFVTGGTYYNYSTYLNDGKSTPNPLFMDYGMYAPYVMPAINYLESMDYTLNLNWQITDTVSLLSVTSYREYLNEFADDNDGSPLSVQALLQRMDHEQWTQEFRLNASLRDGYADLTLGAFYLDKQTDEDARVDLNYAALHFLHGPDLVPSEAKALYGQLSLHLSDRSDLSLGLRYSEDEKSYTFHRHNPDGTSVSGPVVTVPAHWQAGNPLNAGVYGVDGLAYPPFSSSRWDYRAALDYDFTDNVMGYVQIATGYKAGGANARPFFPSQIHATKPEELINYEIGVKSTLWDQLRLNASAFFNDYTELQLLVSECSWSPEYEQTPCAAVANVGDAEVKGFEVEGVWSPTRAFSLDFSYSYLKFKYTKLDESTGVSLDSAAPFTPKHQASIGAQYTLDLGDVGDVTARVDYAYQDEHFAAALNTRTALIDDYGVVNGRLMWRSEDTKWELSLEGTNLTDKYYYLTLYDLYTGAGYTSGQPARPRELAFTVKRYFFTD
ncbi:MAG: TonB-dependent receptor [Deltaproteobacteria bacterium]|nr:TonB-dependent receptor [Deltaproteobacteria bacterium]